MIAWGLSAEADFGTRPVRLLYEAADHPFDCIILLRNGFETLPESFTEGGKNVRNLPSYFSVQRDPEFFSAYHR
jgi:hypothetical protein